MIPIADNTLYYTLSTIAQSVAAAFAFLGAFVLFRLQAADARLKDIAVTLAGTTSMGDAFDRYQHLIATRSYQELYKLVSVSANVNASFNASYTALGAELKEATRLQTQFRWLAIPSLALIGASVIALSLVDQYSKTGLVAGSVLAVFIGWFVFVLYKMGALIRGCIP